MLLLGLALGFALVPFVKECPPCGVLVGAELVTDGDVGRRAVPEVLDEAAGEVGDLEGLPFLLAGSRRAG
jgi:hypothetical protein